MWIVLGSAVSHPCMSLQILLIPDPAGSEAAQAAGQRVTDVAASAGGGARTG